MKEWIWLLQDVILSIHDEQLAEHGGASGVRDRGGLESALGRPLNKAAYETPDVAALSAAYAFGIVRNHPFVDGNKRTAYVAAELFLAVNGFYLIADDAAAISIMLDLAAGKIGEAELTQWLRENIRPATKESSETPVSASRTTP
jgi:death-on-curing protein